MRNRFYIGEVKYKGEVFLGEQPAILDRTLFDAVQTKLDQQRTNHTKARQQSNSLLIGRIFDDHGNRMTPTYAVKKGVRYRYYISSPLIQGQPDKAAKLNRVPAVEIERPIISAVRKHLGTRMHNEMEAEDPISLTDKELVSTHIARVDVKQDHLAIQLTVMPQQRSRTRNGRRTKDCKNSNEQSGLNDQGARSRRQTANNIVVPWKKTPSKKPREIILPAPTSSRQDRRPIRAETRAKLVTAIATARQWLDEIVEGTITNVEQIADREKCSIRQVNRNITLAFLAPTLAQAAVDGRLPRGLGVATLRDLPTEWKRQHEQLGLSA